MWELLDKIITILFVMIGTMFIAALIAEAFAKLSGRK